MPLKKGVKNIGGNIKKEMAAGKPQRPVVTIGKPKKPVAPRKMQTSDGYMMS